MPKKSKKKNKTPMTEEQRNAILKRFSTVSVPRNKTQYNEDSKKSLPEIPKKFRKPIVVVMGHVDHGKTSLLDSLRQSNITKGEKGGITQQIGATDFPFKRIHQITGKLKSPFKIDPENVKLPGFLMIDTPGHEAFHNLRERGSSLCDFAILVVDIEDGLMPQTKDSIKLLKDRNIPFIIAATKIDKIYGWEKYNFNSFKASYRKQSDDAKGAFYNYIEGLKEAFLEFEINADLHYSFKNVRKNNLNLVEKEESKLKSCYPIVPVCSLSGEGTADIFGVLYYIMEKWMKRKVKYDSTDTKAIIMELDQVKGYGWTADVILVNGTIQKGDKFLIYNQDEETEITVKNILTPPPLTQLGNKNSWTSHDKVEAAMGVKIIANNIEKTFAGNNIFKITDKSDLKKYHEIIEKEKESFNSNFDFNSKGIWIQSPNRATIEALMIELKKSNIPIKGYTIGKLSEKSLNNLSAIYQETENPFLLYFGDPDKKLCRFAQDKKIKMICSEVIYHLIEEYKKLFKDLLNLKKDDLKDTSEVFLPCKMNVLKKFIINKGGNGKEIILGMQIVGGKVTKNTKLCAVKVDKKGKLISEVVKLGKVLSIQKNKKELDDAKMGDSVAIKMDNSENHLFGRQFDDSYIIISELSRKIIDNLKLYCRDEINTKEYKLLFVEIMRILNIQKNVTKQV